MTPERIENIKKRLAYQKNITGSLDHNERELLEVLAALEETQQHLTNAITFEKFVEYGKNNGGNIVNGMPWSFNYNGHPVTHENDECYLIPTSNGVHRFTPQDVLIVGVNGEVYPCRVDGLNDQLAEAQQTIARQREVWQELKSVVSTNATGGRGEDINDYDIMLNIMGDLEGETQP